jgi:hypothetical protein
LGDPGENGNVIISFSRLDVKKSLQYTGYIILKLATSLEFLLFL